MSRLGGGPGRRGDVADLLTLADWLVNHPGCAA